MYSERFEHTQHEAQRGAQVEDGRIGRSRQRVADDGRIDDRQREGRRHVSERDVQDGRVRDGGRAAARGHDEPPKRKKPLMVVVLVAVLLAIAFGLLSLCSSVVPITVTVNGTECQLRGDKTMQGAIKESGLPVNPGDFISLQGNILRRSEGYPFCAYVNGEETADPEYQLNNGDQIELRDGKDRVEEYDAAPSPVPFEASIVGTGPVRTFSGGVDGVLETRTGRTSGEVVEKQTEDPQDIIETRQEINVGSAKTVALTFDGGPTEAYTTDILNILKENDAKATFFFLGSRVERGGGELVKKAASQGCQICSHSYSDAEVTNGDLRLLSADEQRAEIEQGFSVLADVLGTEPSHMVRVGQDDIPLIAIPNIGPLVDAEIGWTLDTGDWIYVGEDEIYNILITAKPGDIIRMHDGGGQLDETVSALKRALPELKNKGYSFVTVEELIAESKAHNEG